MTLPLNKYIDHTLLKPEATDEQIVTLCEEAVKYDFMSVCVQPYRVAHAKSLLEGSSVKVCTVIGFPLGANTTAVKAYEAGNAIQDGATEIDMVINIGALKDGNDKFVEADIKAVVEVAHPTHLVKVIIETCLLTDAEKIRACEIVKRAGADFVKTSTGFSTGGATATDITLMRMTVGPDFGVKASGGVRNYADAQAMIMAGATRLGTSNGVAIMTGQTAKGNY